MREANVYMVKPTDKGESVLVSLGYCDPISMEGGKVNDAAVEELGGITIPIQLLPDIIKKMITIGIDYQKMNQDIGINIVSEDEGQATIRL